MPACPSFGIPFQVALGIVRLLTPTLEQLQDHGDILMLFKASAQQNKSPWQPQVTERALFAEIERIHFKHGMGGTLAALQEREADAL